MAENITIERASLIYKNFQGAATAFNQEGNRNFGVLLDDDMAKHLSEEGWNVKYRKPREDDPEQYRQPWLPVKVKFGDRPPIAVLINSRGKRRLTEETIGQLDWTLMENVDLIIRPYHYPEMAGRPAGISAYMNAIYVTIMENDLERKYADVRDLDEEEVPFD